MTRPTLGDGRSGSLRAEPTALSQAKQPAAIASGEPSRDDLTAWALDTVNSMVTLGIIENTVEARKRHLDGLLAVLLSDDAK